MDETSLSSSSAVTSVELEVIAPTAPTVEFEPLALPDGKQPATWLSKQRRLTLTAHLSLEEAEAAAFGDGAFFFEWTAYAIANPGEPTELRTLAPSALEGWLALVANSNGGSVASLAIASGALSAGATYVFELSATALSAAAVAAYGAAGRGELSVRTNQAPHGGSVQVDPPQGIAAQTRFSLRALGWNDDADDYPLTFSFAFATALDVQGSSGSEGNSVTLEYLRELAAGARALADWPVLLSADLSSAVALAYLPAGR
jgi:hypothetical protein